MSDLADRLEQIANDQDNEEDIGAFVRATPELLREAAERLSANERDAAEIVELVNGYLDAAARRIAGEGT